MAFKGEIIGSTAYDDIADASIHIDDIRESDDVEWLSRVYSMLDETREDCKDWHQTLHNSGLTGDNDARRAASKITFMGKAMRFAEKRLWELDCQPPARLNSFSEGEKLKSLVVENKKLRGDIGVLRSEIGQLKKLIQDLRSSDEA